MTKSELHRLVDKLPDDAVEGASVLLQHVLLQHLDPSQAWVWTTEWQDKLHASLADIQAGRSCRYGSDEEFLQALA